MNENGEGRLARMEEALREGFARLEGKVDGLRSEIDGLRGEVDGFRQEFNEHRGQTTDSFQDIAWALEALHGTRV